MSEYKVAILAKGASPDLSEKARKMAAEINANPAEFTKKMAYSLTTTVVCRSRPAAMEKN